VPATSGSASALDLWLPEFHVATHHARASGASPERLWRAAREVKVRETRTLRPLIAWRLGADGDMRFAALFTQPPFVLLAEGERESISGLAGRLWSRRPHYVELDSPEAFRAFAEPGFGKIALRHAVHEHPDGSEVVSEGRVWCTSAGAWRRFRPYWAFVGPFARFVGPEPLSAAVRRAERSSEATS
jgi:hypothetical protein